MTAATNISRYRNDYYNYIIPYDTFVYIYIYTYIYTSIVNLELNAPIPIIVH